MKAKGSGIWLLLLGMMAILAGCSLGAAGGDKGEDVGGELESAAGGYTWRRTGGIAGFCDVVELSADGSATVASCASDPPRTVAEARLTTSQLTLVREWVERYDSFTYEQSDPATADAMTLSVRLNGQGDEEPAENDIAAMMALAQEVLIQATR